jgi:hypothetical protein
MHINLYIYMYVEQQKISPFSPFKDEALGQKKPRKSLSHLPPSDAIVVHLRLGDDVERLWRRTDIWDGKDHRKVKNKAYFETAVEEFPKKVKTIIIVGSVVHRNYFSDSKGSEWYTAKVVEFFRARGLVVVQRLSSLPVDDFVYTASARTILSTGGGYGDQASRCVDRLNGTTIDILGGPRSQRPSYD